MNLVVGKYFFVFINIDLTVREYFSIEQHLEYCNTEFNKL